MPPYQSRHISAQAYPVSHPRFYPQHRTLAHLNINQRKKPLTPLPCLPLWFSKSKPPHTSKPPQPQKQKMKFRTLHLHSQPSPNGVGFTWNYIRISTTLPLGDILPFENLPAFSNQAKILWIEAKRVCEVDPTF